MKTIERFAGKRLPYKEKEDYVSQLISECTEKALSGNVERNRKTVKTFWLRLSSAAAVLTLVLTVCFGLAKDYDVNENSATLAEVLATMSDEQVMDLYCYELEIPEYYE